MCGSFCDKVKAKCFINDLLLKCFHLQSTKQKNDIGLKKMAGVVPQLQSKHYSYWEPARCRIQHSR